MYAVTVTFRIKPGQEQAFMGLMVENARTSRDTEVGCHRFDVLSDPERPDTVFLYELYTDRAAFDLHLAAPHFHAFDTASAPLINSKEVATWQEVQP